MVPSLSTILTAGSAQKPLSSSEQLLRERTGELAAASLLAPGPARKSLATLKKKLDGISRAQTLAPVPSLPVHATENPMPCHPQRNKLIRGVACWPLPPLVAEWGATAYSPDDFSFVLIQEKLARLAVADDLPAAHGDRLCVRRADTHWSTMQ